MSFELLTKREKEIARLYGKTSLSQKDIGKKLFISSTTVKTHIKNIYRKLGVNNRISVVLTIMYEDSEGKLKNV